MTRTYGLIHLRVSLYIATDIIVNSTNQDPDSEMKKKKVTIGVIDETDKLLSILERLEWARKSFYKLEKKEVRKWEKLTHCAVATQQKLWQQVVV